MACTSLPAGRMDFGRKQFAIDGAWLGLFSSSVQRQLPDSRLPTACKGVLPLLPFPVLFTINSLLTFLLSVRAIVCIS